MANILKKATFIFLKIEKATVTFLFIKLQKILTMTIAFKKNCLVTVSELFILLQNLIQTEDLLQITLTWTRQNSYKFPQIFKNPWTII